MLVCHCRAVYDSRIRDEILGGARDEFDIAARCGAGGGCGGCIPVVSEILAEYSLGSAGPEALRDGVGPARLVDER